MGLIWLLIIGAAAGFLATRLFKWEANIWQTLLIGIVGALLGSLILKALPIVLGMASGIVGAVLGALVLVWVWQKIMAGHGK